MEASAHIQHSGSHFTGLQLLVLPLVSESFHCTEQKEKPAPAVLLFGAEHPQPSPRAAFLTFLGHFLAGYVPSDSLGTDRNFLALVNKQQGCKNLDA